MSYKLSGAGVALVTPFTNNNEVDFSALGKLVDFVTQNGVDYLVVLGTTGETPTLNSTEKQQIIDFVIKQNAGKLPIVLGVGSNNTAELVSTLSANTYTGVDAILSVTPYYNKPSQKGLYAHYKAISEATPLPILLYNVPGRTGINMLADTTLKLAHDFKNIIGIKEASPDLGQMAYILRDRPNGFLVISGDDGLSMPQLAMGIDGVISVAANAYPKEVSNMVALAKEGNSKDAATIHLKLIELFDLLFAEGNPAGVKAALYLKDIIQNNLRLPLIPASETLIQKLKKFI